MAHRAVSAVLAAFIASTVLASDLSANTPHVVPMPAGEPLSFVETGPNELTLHSNGLVIRLNAQGLVFASEGASSIFWSWVNGAPRELVGVSQSDTPYFRGAKSGEYGQVKAYRRVIARDVWPGVDVIFETRNGAVEYSLALTRARDLDSVRFRYDGAQLTFENGAIAIAGGLNLHEKMGRCSQAAEIDCSVVPYEDNEYGFTARSSEPESSLLIDPTITWTDGNGSDLPFSSTSSMVARASDLTVVGTAPENVLPDGGTGIPDVFIERVSPGNGQRGVGSFVVQLGGSGGETAAGVMLDLNANITVCGTTNSTGWLAQPCNNITGNAGYVVGLTADASVQLFDNCIDGAGDDRILGCESILNSGAGRTDIIVAGRTTSAGLGQGSNAWDQAFAANNDGFVAYLDGIVANTQWFSYVGGTQNDEVAAVTVQGTSIYAAGHSSSADIAQVNSSGVGPPFGAVSAFVLKLNGGSGSAAWWRWIGGNSDDEAFAVAANSTTVYAGGNARSSATNIPQETSLAPYYKPGGTNGSGFIAALNANDGSDQWFTFVGGTGYDQVDSLDPEGNGRLFFSGRTVSTDLPTKNPLQASYGGDPIDGFVGAIDLPSRRFLSLGYLGGNGNDRANTVKFNTTSLYIGGTANSINFPYSNPTGSYRAWLLRTDGWPTDPNFGEPDAGQVVDAGQPDAGAVDAGENDAGENDAGQVDAGETDGGATDGGEVTPGGEDGGTDGGTGARLRSPAGCGCNSAPGAAAIVLAIAALARRRRPIR